MKIFSVKRLGCSLTVASNLMTLMGQEFPRVAEVQNAVKNGNSQALDKLKALPIQESLPALRAYALRGNPAISEKALAVLRDIPQIESTIENDIRQRAKSGFYDPKIKDDFDLFVKLNTADAVRKSGGFLFDDVILKSGMEDVFDSNLKVYGAMTLQQFELPEAPSVGGARSGVTEKELENWKSWWKKNESRIDELVAEAKREPSSTRSASLNATPKSATLSTPATAPAKTESRGFSIWPIATLSAMVVAGAVFLGWRRLQKRTLKQ